MVTRPEATKEQDYSKKKVTNLVFELWKSMSSSYMHIMEVMEMTPARECDSALFNLVVAEMQIVLLRIRAQAPVESSY